MSWTEIVRQVDGHMLWAIGTTSACFAAEFAVKSILFRRIGVSRGWVYSFSIASGLAVLPWFYFWELWWLLVIAFIHNLVTISIWGKRLKTSHLDTIGNLCGIYSIPVFGILISFIWIISETKIGKKIFYDGEIGRDNPWSAIIYAAFMAVVFIAFAMYVYYLMYDKVGF